MRVLQVEPLTAAAFGAFGDVLEAVGRPERLINQGLCKRFDDRAKLDFGTGRAGLSVFQAEPRRMPYRLDMIERHPEGSQAFLPMSADPFLVIASDGPDATPRAFMTNGGQGVNLHRGTWHGVLTPLSGPGLFAVIDRIGDGVNLEEHWFGAPWVVTDPG